MSRSQRVFSDHRFKDEGISPDRKFSSFLGRYWMIKIQIDSAHNHALHLWESERFSWSRS
ncbi:hypothetical protein AKJ16_DCAP10422 [Drosera capensis]